MKFIVWQIVDGGSGLLILSKIEEHMELNYNLHTFFRMEDHELFFQYMRMPEKTFALLYEKLRSKLKKQNTRLRESLSPELRLSAVLV